MPTSHEQKADIGLRFTAEIKRRIEVRTEAQKRAAEQAKAMNLEPGSGFGCPELEAVATKVAKLHRFQAIGAKLDETYKHGRSALWLILYGQGGAQLSIPVRDRPDMAKAVALYERQQAFHKAKGDCCREIEFLTGMLKPAQIASFQAHAVRLWAPNASDDRMPEPLFKSTLDDFLQGKRPAVCAV